MLLITDRRPPRTLRLKLRCRRACCGTEVAMAGDENDPILLQVNRWGSSCPKCKGDLDVISRVTVPTRPGPNG